MSKQLTTVADLHLEALQPLDLEQSHTVGDILLAMSRCSFGARMVGEVSRKLLLWLQTRYRPIIIYDGRLDTPVGSLLKLWVERGWFQEMIRPEEYENAPRCERNVLVVGPYSERHENRLHARDQAAIITVADSRGRERRYYNRDAGTTIYLNNAEQCRPDQVRDGHFPDVVFADHQYTVPLIDCALEEWTGGLPWRVTDFLERLHDFGRSATQASMGARTILDMQRDRRCQVALTYSGAMTVAQLGGVIETQIRRRMGWIIVSTGALQAHGIVRGLGLQHFKYDPRWDDQLLAKLGLNRVTDTLEPEGNFDQIDLIMRLTLDSFMDDRPISPSMLLRRMGEILLADPQFHNLPSIVTEARAQRVMMFIPAFTDCELGNDAFVHNVLRQRQHKPRLTMDMELDTRQLMDWMTQTDHAGIWTVGGGVPRNWTQNVSPLIEIHNARLQKYAAAVPMKKFRFGCRCSPDAMHHGHLSGCTYEEGVSWRKFHWNGHFAQIRGDATIIWPLHVKCVMDWQDGRQHQPGRRRAAA